jgi:hypothetical protein
MLLSLLAIGFSTSLLLAETATKSTVVKQRPIEKIEIMLEYNQRMVNMIQNYMKDRGQIPDDYRDVSDNEFLRRAKMEKPMVMKTTPSTSSSDTTKPKPVKK